MKKVKIYFESTEIQELEFTHILDEEDRKSFLVKNEENVVAIVPYNYLIVMQNDNVLTK